MNHLVIAPVLVPLCAGILILLLRPLPVSLRRTVSVAGVIGQVVVAVALLLAVSGGEIHTYALGDWSAPFGIVLVADRLAVWMLLITALLALFALLYGIRGTDVTGRHFHVLFQLQLFGLNGAFLTGDLFNLFVFFEVLLLASYGLLLHGGGRRRTAAGMHFVIVNLAGSALFLLAAGTLYGVTGTLNMADLARRIALATPDELGLVQAGGLLLFGVFALKGALIPLHLWLPAAYANASAPVAALFAVMTKVGAYSILRLDTLFFGAAAGPAAGLLDGWLLPLALATLVLGSLGVLAAHRLRQQIAYLVIVSMGSLLTAFGLHSTAGIAAGLYYLPHATFAVAGFFLLADSVATRRGEFDDRLEPLATLQNRRLLGGGFLIVAVLIAGLPPLSGFLAKFLILRSALDHPAMPWVLGIVLVTSLLGVVALARSGSVLFYQSAPADLAIHRVRTESLAHELLPAGGLLVLCLALVVWAGPTEEFARATAEQLLQPSMYINAVLGPATGATP